MNRPFLTLMATGLSLMPGLAHAETLPLPLTGPAYVTANEAYSAYERKDYDLAIAKAREALRQRADITRLNTLIVLAQRDKELRDHPKRYPQSRQAPGFGAAAQAFKAYDRDDFGSAAQAVTQSHRPGTQAHGLSIAADRVLAAPARSAGSGSSHHPGAGRVPGRRYVADASRSDSSSIGRAAGGCRVIAPWSKAMCPWPWTRPEKPWPGLRKSAPISNC